MKEKIVKLIFGDFIIFDHAESFVNPLIELSVLANEVVPNKLKSDSDQNKKTINLYGKDIKESLGNLESNDIKKEDLFNAFVTLATKSRNLKHAIKRDSTIVSKLFYIYSITIFESLLYKLFSFLGEENSQCYKKLCSLSPDESIKTIPEFNNEKLLEIVDKLMEKPFYKIAADFKKVTNINFKKLPKFKKFEFHKKCRNLIVHSDGIVNEKFIKFLKRVGIENNLKRGDLYKIKNQDIQLIIEDILILGSSLIFKVWNKYFPDPIDLGDYVFISCIRLIEHKFYEACLTLTSFYIDQFSRNISPENFNNLIIINIFAAKYTGNSEKLDFWEKKLPSYELLKVEEKMMYKLYCNEYDEVYKLMKLISTNSEFVTKDFYQRSSFFKELESKPKFKDTFEKIFNEKYKCLSFRDYAD